MKIIQAYFTNHPCYNAKRKAISPVGVFVHSTGAVNRELRRYVDAENELGKNQYNNHWNKVDATKSVHAFIGYDKDKNVIVAETLPHDIACWGAGKGDKGSYNYNPHAYLQFEICQGSNTDSEYYWKAIAVAEEYCAYLCQLYGWTAANITSHAEAHKAGYASNHGDPVSWMKYFGDSMDKFRERVQARLDGGCGDPDTPAANEKTETEEEDVTESDTASLPTLRKGDKGDKVSYLQELLNDAYPNENIAVDGIFGTATLTAVRAFQYDHGLDPDGVVGVKTWMALESQSGPVTREWDSMNTDEKIENLNERLRTLEGGG